MNFHLKHIVVAAALLGTTAFAVPVAPALAAGDEFTAYLYDGSCAQLSADKVVDEFGVLKTEGNETHWWDRLLSSPNQPGENVGAVEEKDLKLEKDFPDQFRAVDKELPDMTLGELMQGEHAVAIKEKGNGGSNVVACGDIAGAEKDGTLLIGLPEVGDSGYEGRAFFGPAEGTNVFEATAGVWTAGEVLPHTALESTPAATPTQ